MARDVVDKTLPAVQLLVGLRRQDRIRANAFKTERAGIIDVMVIVGVLPDTRRGKRQEPIATEEDIDQLGPFENSPMLMIMVDHEEPHVDEPRHDSKAQANRPVEIHARPRESCGEHDQSAE